MSENTKRVLMLTSLSGADVAYDANTEYDLPEQFAVALCTEPAEDPRATPVGWTIESPGAKRTAAVKTPETATAPPARTATAPKAEKATKPEKVEKVEKTEKAEKASKPKKTSNKKATPAAATEPEPAASEPEAKNDEAAAPADSDA